MFDVILLGRERRKSEFDFFINLKLQDYRINLSTS